MPADADRLDAYARLIVRVGLNLQHDQLVHIAAQPEHAPLVRAVARVAYEEGARYVDVSYSDSHVRRALVARGPEEWLDHSPEWLVSRLEYIGEHRGARVAIVGEPDPELFADLDQRRVGRSRMSKVVETSLKLATENRVSWTIAAFPNDGWARAVFGEPDVERLWEAVASCVRLDEPDPVAAWEQHIAALRARTAALNERRFDAVRFRGPGTDLTVGLLAAARWEAAQSETLWGQRYVPNLPTEEVFTTPDPRRTAGTVRSTRPLHLLGTIVRDLELRFEDGRVVDVRASAGEGVVRTEMDSDEGARRLGEVALVDAGSKVGRTGVTFLNTLFDENATCHIAYGQGFGALVDESAKDAVNTSTVHTDFMIGGPEVAVVGVDAKGGETPIIVNDAWQLN